MTAPAPLASADLHADLHAALDAAIAAVRAAGSLLLDLQNRPLEVASDFAHDIKLIADQRSEALILQTLADRFPLPVLTEETGEHGPLDPAAAMWVVDPLDGTFNYFRSMPCCCSCVGLVHAGRPVLGAVYDFFSGRLFTGIASEGAWLNGRPIRCSAVAEPAQAALATGFPHHFDYSSPSLAAFVRRVRAFKKIRMLGSAALMAAYVAAGWFDVYLEDDIWLWDVAAASAIALGAGAHLELSQGSAGPWAREIVLSSTPALADALRKI